MVGKVISLAPPILFEMGAMWGWFTRPSLLLFLVLHGYSTLFLIIVCRVRILTPGQRNLVILVIGLWAVVPLMGPIAASLLYLALQKQVAGRGHIVAALSETAESEDDFFRELSREVMKDREVDVKTDPNTGAEPAAVAVQPFLDVLKSKDFEAKKLTIMRLSYSSTSESIRLLKIAQKDSNYDIQYLATNALLAIESEWYTEIKTLERSVELDPSVTLQNDLVSSYLRVCGSGLFTRTIEHIYLKRALVHAQLCVQLRPKDAGFHTSLGKVYLYLDNYSQALECFERAVHLEPNVPGYRFWKAETLYFLQAYPSVEQECQTIAEHPNLHPKIAPIVKFWSSHAL
ncbi:MAG: tetratricopeptide repeat protein [Deltaproteobacteria bacterium]|nr:tetratricopeptide repeat protein [Deltaproteobacteria bacterium]